MSRTWLPLVLALAVSTALFASTRMTTISGCPGEYCVDSGEFQVALALGGTVHHTGYPLYMLIGTPFVRALSWVGVAPAEGAVWYSLVWALGAVAAAWWAARIVLDDGWLAVLPALVLATLPVVWLHAAIPEVYSLHFFFSAAIVALTLRLKREWSPRLGCALAALAGFSIAHHRLAVPTSLTAAVLLLPEWRRTSSRWRWLAIATLIALLGFAPYLDIPLRAYSGARWIYGDPRTWEGFWFIFSGQEAAGFGQLQLFPNGLLGSLSVAANAALDQLGWPIVIAAIAGLIAGLTGASTLKRDTALVLAFAVVGLVFAAAYVAVLPVPVMVFPTLMAAALLTGVAVFRLKEWTQRITLTQARAITVSLALVWAGSVGLTRAPEVSALATDDSNQRFMRSAETDLAMPKGAVLMAPFGPRFNALAYAKYVNGALADVQLVDHRSDFGALVGPTGRVYMAAETPFVLGLDWWRERLGPDLSVNSAGAGWISIGPRQTAPLTPTVVLGDGIGIHLVSAERASDGAAWHVAVEWSAVAQPVRDYSTVVFGSDQEILEITAPDQIVAQSDSGAPVYGWYPTTRWRAGETVREDHVLAWPDDRELRSLIVGMYVQEADGTFTTLGRTAWHLADGNWTLVSGDASRH